MSEADGVHCQVCGKDQFSLAHDEWMRRAFPFVEQGQLKMCAGCGAKYLVCESCGGEGALHRFNGMLICDSCREESWFILKK